MNYHNAYRIDSFGLTVGLTALDGWAAYQRAKERAFGSNWLTRWWMFYVYRHLFPERYQRRLDIFKTYDLRIKQELMNEVMLKGLSINTI